MSDRDEVKALIEKSYRPKPERLEIWFDDNLAYWYALICQVHNGYDFFYLLTLDDEGEILMEIELTPEFQKLYPKFIKNGGK